MGYKQIANTVVMVSPEGFGNNDQTASTNKFQGRINPLEKNISFWQRANIEFWRMVEKLEVSGIKVVVLRPPRRKAPDSIFPNNWFSTYGNRLVVYPMLSPNRRDERQAGRLVAALKAAGCNYRYLNHLFDASKLEREGSFLEGTGSLVFAGHGPRIDKESATLPEIEWAFVALSARSTLPAIRYFTSDHGPFSDMKWIVFDSIPLRGESIYHTNVLLSVGVEYAVICFEAIAQRDRDKVRDRLIGLDKQIIEISLGQLESYCANILQLKNVEGNQVIVMSSTARNQFNTRQLTKLSQYGEIVTVEVPTIERIGGGSARCMMAEIFSE